MALDLRHRYDSFADRVLSTLSEVEREDVRAFDRWFYATGGWRWLFVIVGTTTAFAWVASRLPWNMSFVEAAILFNLVVLMLIWAGLSAWFGYRRFQGKIFRFVVVGPLLALAGAFVGAAIAGLVQGVDPLGWLADSAKFRHVVTAGLVFGFLYALVVALIAHLRNREYAALTARLAAEARQSELSRQLAESQLRMLQLQVEPHFLFNTLAHVRRLYEIDPSAGASMLGNLKDYLSIALPQMRDGGSTLGREIDHVVAYLGIQQIRMGRRLAFAVDVPDGLRAMRMPSLMILTLVENAVKHGVGPRVEGGRIDVRATTAEGRLRIDVADDGRGFVQSTGGGTGLANIRARLASNYGPAAGLSLALNASGGVTATIVLPAEPASAGNPQP